MIQTKKDKKFANCDPECKVCCYDLGRKENEEILNATIEGQHTLQRRIVKLENQLTSECRLARELQYDVNSLQKENDQLRTALEEYRKIAKNNRHCSVDEGKLKGLVRGTVTHRGEDAFYLYQTYKISKGLLCGLIAKAIKQFLEKKEE